MPIQILFQEAKGLPVAADAIPVIVDPGLANHTPVPVSTLPATAATVPVVSTGDPGATLNDTPVEGSTGRFQDAHPTVAVRIEGNEVASGIEIWVHQLVRNPIANSRVGIAAKAEACGIRVIVVIAVAIVSRSAVPTASAGVKGHIGRSNRIPVVGGRAIGSADYRAIETDVSATVVKADIATTVVANATVAIAATLVTTVVTNAAVAVATTIVVVTAVGAHAAVAIAAAIATGADRVVARSYRCTRGQVIVQLAGRDRHRLSIEADRDITAGRSGIAGPTGSRKRTCIAVNIADSAGSATVRATGHRAGAIHHVLIGTARGAVDATGTAIALGGATIGKRRRTTRIGRGAGRPGAGLGPGEAGRASRRTPIGPGAAKVIVGYSRTRRSVGRTSGRGRSAGSRGGFGPRETVATGATGRVARTGRRRT